VKAHDLTGQRFGKLVVTGRAGTSSSGNATWWCLCDCGNTTRPSGSDLRLGRSQTCGCGNVRPRSGEARRLWDNVAVRGADECWPWTGALTRDGYGRIRDDSGRKVGVHRLAWTLTNGPVPDGQVIDHLCRERACCNPAHMEPVDNRTNLMRGDTHAARNAAKTHCIRGHEFSEANTYVDALGKRVCRTCRQAHKKQARMVRRLSKHTQEKAS